MSSDLVYAQREIDNLINLLADARTENMKLNEYIKRQAMDILLCKSGNDTLHEENTRLRAALEAAACYDDGVRGSNMPRSGVWYGWKMGKGVEAELTVEDLRNARAAMEEGMTSPDEREDCTGLRDARRRLIELDDAIARIRTQIATANPCGREDCEEEGRT